MCGCYILSGMCNCIFLFHSKPNAPLTSLWSSNAEMAYVLTKHSIRGIVSLKLYIRSIAFEHVCDLFYESDYTYSVFKDENTLSL